MSWVWEHGPKSGTDRLVLLALANFCDDAGACFPSVGRIAEMACVTPRGAQKALRRMADAGVISIETGGGRSRCNRYSIALNPERHSLNTVHPEPQTANEVHPLRPKPRTQVHETLNGGSPEPSVTVNSISKTDAREKLVAVLGEELTASLISHRKAIRKPITAEAAVMLAAKLGKMRDPPAAVRRSIENGWTGVFEDDKPEKQDGQHSRRVSAFLSGARR
jgi:DNA-binding MarR family transcriptional regulator